MMRETRYPLADAALILADAETTTDMQTAEQVLQLVGDGLWEYGKLAAPTEAQRTARDQLFAAMAHLTTKEELGLLGTSSLLERRAYTLALRFANLKKRMILERESSPQPGVPTPPTLD